MALSTVRWSELFTADLLNIVFKSNVLDRMQLLNLMEEDNRLNSATSRIPCKYSR